MNDKVNMFPNIQLVKVKVAVGAGTTDIICDPVDMTGWDSVMFIAAMGAITATAVTSLYATQCDTIGGVYADLEGTAVAIADTESLKNAALDLVKPEEQFVQAVISRSIANAVITGVLAILYNKHGLLQDNVNDTTVLTSKVVVSPEEGTP